MPYGALEADCVIETIERKAHRIVDRFADFGLTGVTEDLGATALRRVILRSK